MVAALRRRARVDDDDDPSIYDPYWLARGKKVVRDGCAIRTSVMLMDGVPDRRLMLNDASLHRPHQVRVVDSAAQREVDAAYDQRSRLLSDAWRSPNNPPPPDNDGDDDLSSRDRYIQHITGAWRGPISRVDNSVANAVQASMIRSEKLGATPGDEPASIEAARRDRGGALPRGVSFQGGAQDAASDAYDEMCARLRDAWKT